MKDYYEELEVSRNASPDVINRAYKVLAKKYHPDTTTQNKEYAEERFKKISEAYETLSNEQKKLEYDRRLEPEISKEDYLNVLENNKKLQAELINLKNQLNTFSSHSTQNTSPDFSQHVYTASHGYVNSNPNIRKTPSYSYSDLLKYKIKNFFKNVFAAFLTVIIIFVIVSVLLYIPITRDFILEDLNFKAIFNILH